MCVKDYPFIHNFAANLRILEGLIGVLLSTFPRYPFTLTAIPPAPSPPYNLFFLDKLDAFCYWYSVLIMVSLRVSHSIWHFGFAAHALKTVRILESAFDTKEHPPEKSEIICWICVSAWKLCTQGSTSGICSLPSRFWSMASSPLRAALRRFQSSWGSRWQRSCPWTWCWKIQRLIKERPYLAQFSICHASRLAKATWDLLAGGGLHFITFIPPA